MKKTLIALSVAGLMAGSASAATVYNNDGTKLDVSGSARVMLTKSTGNRADLQNDGSRIKFKFTQQIGDGFSALGFMELRPSDDNFGGGIKTKYLFAGFQADDIGSLTFGKQKTASDAFKLADPAEQDFAIADAMGMLTTSDKNITFRSADFYGLGLETSYLFNGDASKTTQNANGYQVLAKYEQDFDGIGLKLHALYAHQKNGADKTQTPTTSGSQKTWGLAGAVTLGDLGFAVDYASTKLDADANKVDNGIIINGKTMMAGVDKAKGIQIALTYQIAEPMDIYALYHHYTYEAKANMKYIVNGFSLGTHYYLTKNVMTYVEFGRDKLAQDIHNKGTHENAGYVGLRVYF